MTEEERQKLCEELRRTSPNAGWFINYAYLKKAADEIEWLAAEVRKLRDELDLVRRDEERFIYD